MQRLSPIAPPARGEEIHCVSKLPPAAVPAVHHMPCNMHTSNLDPRHNDQGEGCVSRQAYEDLAESATHQEQGCLQRPPVHSYCGHWFQPLQSAEAAGTHQHPGYCRTNILSLPDSDRAACN